MPRIDNRGVDHTERTDSVRYTRTKTNTLLKLSSVPPLLSRAAIVETLGSTTLFFSAHTSHDTKRLRLWDRQTLISTQRAPFPTRAIASLYLGDVESIVPECVSLGQLSWGSPSVPRQIDLLLVKMAELPHHRLVRPLGVVAIPAAAPLLEAEVVATLPLL